MSGLRLALTGGVMAAIAAGLAAVTPGLPTMADALTSAQRTVDTGGTDALVLAAAGLAAWAVWAWGALGLALTALSALPGLPGWLARVLLRGLLPAAARRGVALALGLGVGIATPVPSTGVAVVAAPSATAAPAPAPGPAPLPPAPASPAPAPDWPSATDEPSATAPGAVPDWPDPAAAGAHVVVRGDCLWDVAAARLRAATGTDPATGEVATAVAAWWTTNAAVIGPDPDLLFPGQVLVPPDPP